MELSSRADQRVLRWLGHMERMDEFRMAITVLMAKWSSDTRYTEVRMDGVKVALGNRGMMVEATR